MANNDLVARALAEREKHFQTKGAASAAQLYSPAPSAMVQKALAAQKAEMQRRQVEAPSKLQEINSLLTDWGNGYKQALMDYSGRYQGRSGNYQDKYMADSSQALEGYRANKSALQKNANQITQLLDEYGYYMDQGAVKQIRDQLRHGGRIVEGMEKAYSDSADFFGEFENEDAYIQWQDTQFRTGEAQYQERLDWYDESESRLASLEDINKQYTQMMQKGIQNASGGIYNDGGRYSPGYNSRDPAQNSGWKTPQNAAPNTVANASYGKEAAEFLKQNGFDTIADLRAEIEGLKSERTRYERGEGEWSGYDEEGNKYFRNLTSDRNLAKLTEKGFLDKAEKAATKTYIPSFEELAEMDSKIYDQNFAMDLGPDGQTVAYSSVDGSQLIQDKDGNFHHALEYDPKYTSIDRLGLYLSASAEDKAAHAAISTWDNVYGQGIANHWDFLTPEEVSIYYGLKASSDAEAMDFLAEMQSTLNHRYENAREKEILGEYEKAGWLHRWRMQGRGFIEQGLSGIANAVVMTKSAITGDEVDAYGSTYSGTRYANAVRGAEAERLEKMIPGEVLGMSAGDVYQAFMSAADSALYNAVPVVGTALTALSGSANDVIDKYAQGASNEQIVKSAATTFAIEMATESAGFEKLKLLKEMDVNTWGDYFLNMLKQGGTELLEEETSYVLNGVADMINRRSQSDWSKLWKEYEDNPAMAVGAITGELLQSGLSGLLSGMMGAGASTIRNAARNTAQTRNIGKAVKATKGGIEGLKGYASQIAQNGNDRGLDRFAGKLTGKSSNARVGKAYRMTEASVREQNKAELAKTLQEKGYSKKQAQQIAEAAVSSAAGWRLTEKQQSIWNAVQHDPEVMEAVNHALTGEDSGVRRRNQLGKDFRSGVKAGDMAKSQTLENDDLPEMTQELRRQLRKSGMPVAEEAAHQSDAEDPSTPLRSAQDDSVSQEGADIASPEMRQAMQEAYANDEISEEEYDDYLDALSEQQGMEGVTEEGMRLKEQNDAVQRMQEQADPYNIGQQVTRQMLHNYGVEDTNGGDPSTPFRSAQDDRNTNGGTDNGTGVLHGSGQRNDRASAGEPAGSVAGRAGQDQARGGTGTDRVRAKLYRQDLGQNLREAEAVSSRSQGVTSGTDNATFKVVPESMWDAGMREADEKAYRETGKHITYVVGPIEMVGKDGKVRNARGVTTDAGILVRIDGKMDGERIADHEIFHALMDMWDGQSGRRVILDGLMDELLQHYDREQLRQMLTKYKEALRGIYTEDSDADPGGDVLEDVDYDVLEELLADAYAGINGHAAGADRMQDIVRQWLRDNYIEQDFFQDNGTEQPTGPPSGQKENTAQNGGERYSYGVTQETIDDYIDASYKKENTEDYIKYAEVSSRLLADVSGEIDISDYAHALRDNDIRHIRNSHGEGTNEKYPITKSDLAKIPEIVQSYDKVYVKTNARGEAGIVYVKVGENNVVYYVEAVTTQYHKEKLLVNKQMIKTGIDEIPNLHGFIAAINKKESSSQYLADLQEIRKAYVQDVKENRSTSKVAHSVANVKQQIRAVLDKVSLNHAARMESYTEKKDSDPGLAQKLYDGLMDGPYAVQFEEYLKLAEELERLEGDSSSPAAPQNDSETGDFVERVSVDDSVEAEEGRIATPAEPARNDSGEQEKTSDTEEQKDSYSTLPAKARDYVRSAERNLLDGICKALSVPRAARRDLLAPIVRAITNEYLQNGTVSKQTIDGLFEHAYAQGVVADEEFYRQYEHIKKHMRDTAVTLVEQDRSDIADYYDFKRQAGGLLKIRNEGGLPVDVAYQELQDMAPELFPDYITHPADQLVRMLQVAQSIEVTYRSLSKYYGPDAADQKRDARHEFEEAIDTVLGKLRDAKRYMDDRSAQIDKAPTTVEEAEEAWKQLKAARRNYEKVMAKNLLTEHDQRIVGDLLYGKATLENLDPKRDNVKGITAVYEAKQEYARICKLLTDYKRNLKADLRAEADELLETANEWKDKGSGLAYSRETMRRNVLDIVKDPEVADKILRKYFEPVAVAEAAATRFKEKYRNRVRELDLSRKVGKGDKVSEAHAVQLLGEAMDNIALIESSRGRLKHRDGKTLTEWKAVVQELWESSPSLDRAKIEKAVQEFREIYDDLFQQMNRVRVQNGYEPVNYRRGYFPHFQKESTDGILAHFGRALGISTEVAALPTTINGLTHTFRPGIQWFGNALERTGFATAYDAVEGFDKYIEGVASVIHQTENIQRLRALASQIRYRTSDEGIRKQVDEILKDDRLTEEEKQGKIDDLYSKNPRFSLANFVVELDEYTNLLANKKSSIDRNMERFFGRKSYNFAKWFEQRVAANMIAGNLSSALTNFIPLTQAATRMGNINMAVGMWKTVWSYVKDDGMVETSTFLTNRRGSDPLVRIWQDKVSSIVGLPMELIDQFVADSIVRGAYYRNIKRGLTEDEAMHQADLFAASVMADRSKGAMPTIFAARNPITKLLTMFQLEVNNQFSEIFKDVPRERRSKYKVALAAKLLQYFLGAWLFNELFEEWFGRRPALDPIGILNETIGDFSGYQLPNLLELGVGVITGDMPSFKTEKKNAWDGIKNTAENVLGELPFSAALGFVGIGEDSRIPVESALPDFNKLGKAASYSEWAPEKRWKTAIDEVAKPVTYLALPFGGNQISKIVKGIITAAQGGSYTVDNEGNDILQYPMFVDVWSVLRAAVMGKSALPEAQDWVDSGFDSFSAKATATYQGILDVGVEDRDAYALVDELRHAKGIKDVISKADVQRNILKKSDVSAEGKVVAYCGLVATDTELEWLNRLLELDPDAQSVFDVAVGLKAADALKGDEAQQARAEAIADSALTEAQKIVAVESFLGTKWQTEKGNPTPYAKFRDALETGLTVDDYMELYCIGADGVMDKYLKYTDSGLSATEAAESVKAMYDLTPVAGKEDVSNIQKWRAAVDSQSNAEDQLAALSVEMEASQYRKATVANDYGIAPKAYVSVLEVLPKYNEDGKGDPKQAEVKTAIDAMSGKLSLTTEQKAALWQVVTGSKSAKNNPYSTAIGQQVIDALDKLKQYEEDVSLSFSELVARQIMANM